MSTAAATMAVTIAAGVVGFVAADHTLPDSRELSKVFTTSPPRRQPAWRPACRTGRRSPPTHPAASPPGTPAPSLEVILTRARADGWVVQTDQIFEASKSATIVRTPISAHSSVLQNGDGSGNVIRDEDSVNFRCRGAAVVGGSIRPYRPDAEATAPAATHSLSSPPV